MSARRTAFNVRVALAVGLVLAATAVGVVLSRSPLTVAGTNSIWAVHLAIPIAKGGFGTCQPSGTVREGTSAIRISASMNIGPRVTVTVLSPSRAIVAHGERAAGWGVQETVTVPVARVARTIPDARTCIAFGPAVEPIQVNGTRVNGVTMFRFEYLRPNPASWWSLASSVARRMGFGHAPSGTWVVFLLIALMVAVAILAAQLVLWELR